MKQNRHQKIAELVSRYEIETQEELAEKLKEAGINAAVIGRATEGNDRIIVSKDETRYIGPAGSDELYKI